VGIDFGGVGCLASLSFAFSDVAFPFFSLDGGEAFGFVGDGDGGEAGRTARVDSVVAFGRFALEEEPAGTSSLATTGVGAGAAVTFSAFPFPFAFEPLPTDSLIFASFARLKAIVGCFRDGAEGRFRPSSRETPGLSS
jgi:hypothetical protein